MNPQSLNELFNNITTALIFAINWYGIGLLVILIHNIFGVHIRKLEEVTLEHIVFNLGVALFGPLLIIGGLFMIVNRVFKGVGGFYEQHKKTVLWRSRSGKAKAVLFNNKEDDDS